MNVKLQTHIENSLSSLVFIIVSVFMLSGCASMRMLFPPQNDAFDVDDLAVDLIEINVRVRIGMKKSAVVGIFGSDRKAGPGSAVSHPISFYYRDGFVSGILLGRASYRTARGIGFGDTREKVMRAYPTNNDKTIGSENSITIIYDRKTMSVTTENEVRKVTEQYGRSESMKPHYPKRAADWIYLVFVFDIDEKVKFICIADSIAIRDFGI